MKGLGDFHLALEGELEDFGRLRGVANASKHLLLDRYPPRVANEPTNAANTVVMTTGLGEGAYGVGSYGGTPRVMVEGDNGNDREFTTIVTNARNMWMTLSQQHQWW